MNHEHDEEPPQSFKDALKVDALAGRVELPIHPGALRELRQLLRKAKRKPEMWQLVVSLHTLYMGGFKGALTHLLLSVNPVGNLEMSMEYWKGLDVDIDPIDLGKILLRLSHTAEHLELRFPELPIPNVEQAMRGREHRDDGPDTKGT